MTRPLTAKQEAYAHALIQYPTQADAYRAVYSASRMSPASVQKEASKLLDNPKIARRVSELRDALASEESVPQAADVLRELSRVAFADIREVVRWDGAGRTQFVPSEEIPESVARAIEAVTFERRIIPQRTGEPIEVITQKVSMHSKLPALGMIAKHLGMLPDKVQHSGPDGGPVAIDAQVRERVLMLVSSLDVETLERWAALPEGEATRGD